MARLKGKPLYIRGFWLDETLHFDSSGDLSVAARRSTFTLNGFDLLSTKIKNDKLILYGEQRDVAFVDGVPRRVDGSRLRTIEIAKPPNGDFGPALDAVFCDGMDALAPDLPFYWQAWAHAEYPAAYPNVDGAQAASGKLLCEAHAGRSSGAVIAPRLLKKAEPRFLPHQALRMLRSGPVSACIRLVVRPDGSADKLRIVRPVGMGLDEMALAVAQGYLFAPAVERGHPVSAQIDVEVKFQSDVDSMLGERVHGGLETRP